MGFSLVKALTIVRYPLLLLWCLCLWYVSSWRGIVFCLVMYCDVLRTELVHFFNDQSSHKSSREKSVDVLLPNLFCLAMCGDVFVEGEWIACIYRYTVGYGGRGIRSFNKSPVPAFASLWCVSSWAGMVFYLVMCCATDIGLLYMHGSSK